MHYADCRLHERHREEEDYEQLQERHTEERWASPEDVHIEQSVERLIPEAHPEQKGPKATSD